MPLITTLMSDHGGGFGVVFRKTVKKYSDFTDIIIQLLTILLVSQ